MLRLSIGSWVSVVVIVGCGNAAKPAAEASVQSAPNAGAGNAAPPERDWPQGAGVAPRGPEPRAEGTLLAPGLRSSLHEDDYPSFLPFVEFAKGRIASRQNKAKAGPRTRRGLGRGRQSDEELFDQIDSGGDLSQLMRNYTG